MTILKWDVPTGCYLIEDKPSNMELALAVLDAIKPDLSEARLSIPINFGLEQEIGLVYKGLYRSYTFPREITFNALLPVLIALSRQFKEDMENAKVD